MTEQTATDTLERQGRTYAGQGYEVTRFARKHGISRQQARELIKKIGNDRAKLNQAADELKSEAR